MRYPRSLGEFQAWFRTGADCLDYLEWLRWPDGFVCPDCGREGGWRMADGRLKCASCGVRMSPTAGTIFDKTRTPLTVWFTVCWLFASQKDGISALSVKRSLEIGSYQTAWAMLHRLRSVLVRPGRERLRGEVEVDETYIGGEEPGLRGGRQKGKKVLVGVAVEREQPSGFGRCRMVPIPDASAETLRAFLVENVEPGATVITDGWHSYPSATKDLYVHEPLQGASRADASKLLPGVHKVSSLAKRWLLGTHQGSVDEAHLPGYLNEFVFRFNRRRSRSRGLVFYRVLELAAAHDPVRYRDLIANPRPGMARRPPPATRGRPASLDRPPANRPWRASQAA
jgi:transposase-like protein